MEYSIRPPKNKLLTDKIARVGINHQAKTISGSIWSIPSDL